MSVNIVSFSACFGVALLVMLPLGLLCLWVSYRLGRWMRLTDQTAAIVLGIGVFPLPFLITFMVAINVLLHFLHLSHDGQYVSSGIAVGGWMGVGAARLENLKRQGAGQVKVPEIDAHL